MAHRASVGGAYEAIPDLRHDIEELIADGDKVAWRGMLRGAHKASGKQVATESIAVFRIADGKVAEMWSMPDQLGMMQQIGAMPKPE